MSFKIKPVDGFKRDFKKLAKKYKKLDDDVKKVVRANGKSKSRYLSTI